MAKVNYLGPAQPDSPIYKRGYTVNLNPKPPAKPPEKPAEKKEE